MKTKRITKNLLAMLAVVCMLFSALSPGVFAEGLAGDGTEENPYLIGTAAELAAFRDMVNAEASSERCARLTADIELSGDWTPIYPESGYITEAFSGVFDGGFHTVRGLYINSEKSYQGLFGAVNGAVIRNLKVVGSVTSSNNYVGGIVGKIQQGTVENCSFDGSVVTLKSGGYAGGIAGYAGNSKTQTAKLTGCANTADITGDIKGTAGGIAGYAKYTEIISCYNTGRVNGETRSGGIAGQLQNDCMASDCYNTGEATADICDFLYSSAKLISCFYKENASNAGTGAIESCEAIVSPDTLLEKLGSAFAEDTNNVNGGYPILGWQAGEAPAPKEPSLDIIGSSSIYMTNYGEQPTETLSVRYTDMDAAPVRWTADRADVIELAVPDNADENNSSVIVKPIKPGRAAVTAETENGEYAAELEIVVMPFVTTAEIAGRPVAGTTARAKINIFGGGEYDCENLPDLSVQWRYITEEDYSAGNSASYMDIPGAVGYEFDVPADLAGKYLSFSFRYNGEFKTPSSPKKVYTEQLIEDENRENKEEIDKLSDLFDYYTMYPGFGTDTNALDVLKAELAKRTDKDVRADIKSIEEVYGGAEIAENGDITYFYADPNSTPGIRFGSFKVTYTLSLGDIAEEITVPVIVYWDAERVKTAMRQEISGKIYVDTVNKLEENIELPRVIDGKKWTQISWTSSNPEAISVSGENQQTADSLFDPYVGKVRRGMSDEQVTLTAKLTFMLTNDVTGSETPISLINTYTVTVKAMDKAAAEEIQSALEERLNRGFEKTGLCDAVTGEALEYSDGVYTAVNDIKLPTTRDFGVDGKYTPVSVTSSNSDVIDAPDVNNSARVCVIRPAVGSPDAETVFTVTLLDKDTNISAARSFKVRVPALDAAEVAAEKALMERVAAAYFDGIKGRNTEADNITGSLSPFAEVYEKDGELVWVRDRKDMSGKGIVPTAMDGWEELEAWRLFRSSNPAAVSHEDLKVKLRANAKAVTVTSALSSETLGIYGELYRRDPVRYAAYKELEDLYYREVSAPLVIRGLSTNPGMKPLAVDEKVDVSFTLSADGVTLIDTVVYRDTDETASVFDIFKRALSENGYTYENRGSYIVSVTTPDGRTYKELDDGKNSGWVYKVNGKVPEKNIGACGLENGDEISVLYTKDYTMESDYKKPSSPAGGKNNITGADNSKTDSSVSNRQNEPNEPGTDDKAELSFRDVQGHWAETDIYEVFGRGFMNGVSDTEFDPDGKLTRAMLVTVLYRAEGEPSAESAGFADVAADEWYSDAVAWASENGIVNGVSEDCFAPGENVTREQAAAIMFRYAKVKGYDLSGAADISVYDDCGEVADYAADALAWTAGNGVIAGRTNALLSPRDDMTRAEAAAVIIRMLNKAK